GAVPRGALAPPPPPPPPPSPAAAAPTGRYLFDILALPAQGAAWRAMTGTRAPAWVRNMQGPSAPSKAVTVEGRDYELAWLCRARTCDENQFVVLFTADGATAYGVLRERNRVTFYGDPSEPLRQALVDGFDASR
ncbi:Ivy family c-type lysozyme inhibitor, partial [Alsobacter sp. R-9]